MDERDVLQHLLDVEKQAAFLVQEAQGTADVRLAEREKENRRHFDERYHARLIELEADYQRSLEDANHEFRAALDAFAAELESQEPDIPAFNRTVLALIPEEGSEIE